ncbi:hypothetical protein SFC65_19725 [Priestia filamentosa]|uniref:hypothetical protein n=1 Tax=Priestia filamentosa TaxID=1402861 RepID=UPI003981E8C5
MKTVKAMYRFFDYLYETPEQIDPTVLADWSHKEKPTKVFAVIDVEYLEVQEISIQEAWIYDTQGKAEAEAKAFNEF